MKIDKSAQLTWFGEFTWRTPATLNGALASSVGLPTSPKEKYIVLLWNGVCNNASQSVQLD